MPAVWPFLVFALDAGSDPFNPSQYLQAQTPLESPQKSEVLDDRDIAVLKQFRDDFPNAEFFLLSQDPKPQKIGHVLALPWREGLAALFQGRNVAPL